MPILDQWKVADIKSHEKAERQQQATKNNQKQHKATKSNKKQKRRLELEKPKRAIENQNEQQRATKHIFHSHFHSLAPILDQWKVADIKSHEKAERQQQATKNNQKQQKATKSNKKQKRRLELEKPKQAIENQNEQ